MYGFCSNNAHYSANVLFYDVYFSLNSFWYLRLLLFQFKSHLGVACESESFFYKKTSQHALQQY